MSEKVVWTIEKRIERIEIVKKILKTLGRIEFNKAIAVICLSTGLRVRKVKEYIMLLKDVDFIKIDDGFIEVLSKENDTHTHNEADE